MCDPALDELRQQLSSNSKNFFFFFLAAKIRHIGCMELEYFLVLYKVITVNIDSPREAIPSQLHGVVFNVQHLHVPVSLVEQIAVCGLDHREDHPD